MNIWDFFWNATRRHPLYEMQRPRPAPIAAAEPSDRWVRPRPRMNGVDPEDPGTARDYKPSWAEKLK